MALSKADVSVADLTVTAGTHTEANPQASSAIAVNYGIAGVVRIANGGTGPTTGAQIAVQVRPVGGGSGDWRYWAGPFQAGTAANGSYEFPVSVPVEHGEIRVVGFGPAGANVTMNARLTRLESLV